MELDVRARAFPPICCGEYASLRDRPGHGVTELVTDPGRASLVSEARATLRLAIPLAAAQLAAVGMIATDVVLMGSLGPEALAAGGLAGSIHATVQMIAAGALTTVAPFAAEAYAKRDRIGFAALARHALLGAGCLGLLSMVLVWNAGSVLRALGEPADIVDAAEPFLHAVALATPAVLGSGVVRQLLTVAGRPQLVTYTAFGAVALNGVLDWLFLHGAAGVPGMGIAGVAAATAVVQWLSFVTLVFAARRLIDWRAVLTSSFDAVIARNLVRLGAPVAAMIGAEVALFQLAGLAVAFYGTSALAAHQIGLTLVTVTFVVPLGVAQAASVRVAAVRAVGPASSARRPAGVAVGLAVAFMSCAGVVLWATRGVVVRLFVSDGGDQATTAMTGAILIVAAFFQVFDGAQVALAGALRGLRDTRRPAVLAAVSYLVVGPAAAWVLAHALGLGVIGIWLALAAALATVTGLLALRLLRLTRDATNAALSDTVR
jgi:MATE family multidrug resistance protein